MKNDHGDTRGSHYPTPITDRVNGEPAIVNGLTATEVQWVAVACFLFFGVLGVILYLLTGWWHVAMLSALFPSFAAIWFISLYLAKVKRGRPEGYYVHAIHLWLVEAEMSASRFVRHADYWSLGRTMPGLPSPFHERRSRAFWLPAALRRESSASSHPNEEIHHG